MEAKRRQERKEEEKRGSDQKFNFSWYYFAKGDEHTVLQILKRYLFVKKIISKNNQKSQSPVLYSIILFINSAYACQYLQI